MAHMFFDLGCSKFEESSDFYFSSRRAWLPSVTTYMKTLGGGIMTNDRTLRKYSIKSNIMSYSLKKEHIILGSVGTPLVRDSRTWSKFYTVWYIMGLRKR